MSIIAYNIQQNPILSLWAQKHFLPNSKQKSEKLRKINREQNVRPKWRTTPPNSCLKFVHFRHSPSLIFVFFVFQSYFAHKNSVLLEISTCYICACSFHSSLLTNLRNLFFRLKSLKIEKAYETFNFVVITSDVA